MVNLPLTNQCISYLRGSLKNVLDNNRTHQFVFNNLIVPDNIYQWKATWFDDKGDQHTNRCYRIHQNNALGPYKGGLRFHESVDLDTISFLAFEQTFKNSLTGMQIGGGKGGSDFSPIGKSKNEIRRFCTSFMDGLVNVIGAEVDVPAGDIGVDETIIGYLYGDWLRKTKRYTPGVLTGKNLCGLNGRREATGYGLLFLVNEYKGVKDKTVMVSGAGNVGSHAAKKAVELGAKVVTISDISGTFYCKDGFTMETLGQTLGHIQNNYDMNLLPTSVEVVHGKPWQIDTHVDIALPCATQNELDINDANRLYKNGCTLVAEGSNMGCTQDAIDQLYYHGMGYIGGKLANSGGVMASFIEMQQNANMKVYDNIDIVLEQYMKEAILRCKNTQAKYETDSFMDAVNITGFLRIVDAYKKLGWA